MDYLLVDWGDLTTTSSFKAAEKALREHPNIKRAVGDSLGGAVALELQKHLPELKVMTYGVAIVKLKKARYSRHGLDIQRDTDM